MENPKKCNFRWNTVDESQERISGHIDIRRHECLRLKDHPNDCVCYCGEFISCYYGEFISQEDKLPV